MKPEETSKYARKNILKATLVIVCVFATIDLFMETRGDFANGILFFIAGFFNIVIFGLLGVLFGLAYIFGGLAGKKIIIQSKNFVWVSVKYAVTTGLISTIYFAFAGSAFVGSNTNSIKSSMANYMPEIITFGLTLTILLLVAWLWAGTKMKEFRDKSEIV